MSKSSITRSITVLFVLVISVALVSADLLVTSAQNANSSNTQDEQTRGGMMTSQNGNTSSNTAGRSGRRRRRRSTRRTNTMNMNGDMSNANTTDDTSSNANMTTDANVSTDTSTDASMSGQTGGRRRRRRGRRSTTTATTANTADPSVSMQTGTERTDGGVQEDLAGQSYTGTATYSEGGLSGPATLTFESGNQFTLTPEGGTAMSGRYTAVTTRGYTGVTMMLGGGTGSTPASIVSVRLRRMGNGVSIMSVPGETRQFSFTSSGGGNMTTMSGGGGRRRGRRRRRATRGGIKPPMANPETPATTP